MIIITKKSKTKQNKKQKTNKETKKTIDTSNETLIKTYSIFTIRNGQLDYFFI